MSPSRTDDPEFPTPSPSREEDEGAARREAGRPEDPFPELNDPTLISRPIAVTAPVRDAGASWPDAAPPVVESETVSRRGEPVSAPAVQVLPQPSDAVLRASLDQQARASSWTFYGVFLLLAVQLVYVIPTLELGQRQRRLAGERQRLAELEPRFDAMRQTMGTLPAQIDKVLSPALERLAVELDGDLARLDLTLDQIRAEAAEETASEDDPPGEDDGAASDAGEGWPIADAELRFDLENATTSEDLIRFLTPFVEEQIVRPRFGEVHRVWQAEVLPYLEAQTDGLAADVPRLRGSFPEADDEWAAFANALAGFRRAAREWTLTPPTEDGWWAVTEAGGGELSLRLAESARQQILEPLALDSFNASTGTLFERHGALAARLASELAALPSDGVAVGQSLATMTPGGSALASLFPTLLGLLLASLGIWRTRSLVAVRHALELFPQERTIRWIRAILAGGDPRRPRGVSWAYLRTVAAALLSALWIGIAAWHQDRAGGFAEDELLALLVVGGGAVFAAAVYRLVVLQAIWTIVPRAVVSPAVVVNPAAGQVSSPAAQTTAAESEVTNDLVVARDAPDEADEGQAVSAEAPSRQSRGEVGEGLPEPDDRRTDFLDLPFKH